MTLKGLPYKIAQSATVIFGVKIRASKHQVLFLNSQLTDATPQVL